MSVFNAKTQRGKGAIGLIGLLLLLLIVPVRAQTWQEELAKMPLAYPVKELNEKNCADVMLPSLGWNPVVKALIFMPGATDEFYFFHRAKAVLTNSAPTLLDAVSALTNQTLIVATYRKPFLILHTAEDPIEPIGIVEDPKTAAKIRKREFKRFAVYNDRKWDLMQPMLEFELNVRVLPGTKTHETAHFFRTTFCAWELNGWEMCEAMAMAGKTKFTVKRKVIVFEGDKRFLAKPKTPEGFLLKPRK